MTKQPWMILRLGLAAAILLTIRHYAPRDSVTETRLRKMADPDPAPANPEVSESHPVPGTISPPTEATAESRCGTNLPAKETPAETRPAPPPQPPIRVVQVVANDRLVIECAANGSFLARGVVKRLPDRRWVQDGMWTNYWPKGTVSSVGEWKNGAQVGPWLFTSEDGCSTVTNHPPFVSAVAVTKQTALPGTTSMQDSVAVTKRDDGQKVDAPKTSSEENVGESPGAASSMTAAPSARTTNPDLFVCGKHEEDPFLKDADALFLRGEWSRAKTVYGSYGDHFLNAPERPYAMLQKAVCEERMGKLPEARAAYQDYLRVFGREECGAKGQAGLAALLWKQPSSRTLAIAEYEKLVKNYPKAPEAATALKVLGDYRLGQRDYAKARDCYEKLLANFPEAPGRPDVEIQAEAARLALDCKGKTNGATGLGFDEAVRPAEDLFTRGRYQEAIILYQELATRFRGSPDSAAYCLMQMGLGRFYQGQYAAAVECFETVTAKYPGDGQTPRAYARCAVIADCYLNRPSEVERIAQKLGRDYPDTFEAEQAHFILGESKGARSSKQWRQAYWTDFLRKWPNSVFRQTVSAKLAALPAPSASRINLGTAP